MIKVKVKKDVVHRMLARKNLSVIEFAKKLGIHANTLNYQILGDRPISPERRRKLMKGLGIDLNQWEEIFEEC